MMTAEFCHKCGAKLQHYEVDGFDPITGAPNTKARCPSGECHHYGIEHVWRKFSVGEWVMTLFTYDGICKRCGTKRFAPTD